MHNRVAVLWHDMVLAVIITTIIGANFPLKDPKNMDQLRLNIHQPFLAMFILTNQVLPSQKA
jgi:hypothetical protein